MTIQQLLRRAHQRLAQAAGLQPQDRDSAAREAQILLAHALDCQRSYLFAYPELEISDASQRVFCTLLEQRCQGQPVAYLTGHKEFFGLDLQITEAVLIPRPETELLVEQALERLPPRGSAADLGTGSGAIAVALARHRRLARILATDLSEQALNVARANAQQHRADNIEFYGGHWLDALPRNENNLDIIVSNPPYVEARDRHLSEGDCRFEPRLALTPGDDACQALRHIIDQAPKYLKKDGWLLLEHGFDQAGEVQRLFTATPGWADVETLPDLGGQPRMTMGRFENNNFT